MMRRLWITLTYIIFGLLLIAPLIKIFTGSWADGWSGFVEGITRPQSLHALMMTGIIVVVVTALNTLFGIMLAMYLVRAEWIGKRMKRLLNSLVDLPFAVSPVIGGLMIVLILGPNTIIGALFEDAGSNLLQHGHNLAYH